MAVLLVGLPDAQRLAKKPWPKYSDARLKRAGAVRDH